MSEPAIDAALTPGELLEPCGVAIVVDTIRATTTALYALRQGYAEVICCGSVEDARAAAAEIGPGAILAGERECVRIEGFHLGNSPREFDAGQPLGRVEQCLLGRFPRRCPGRRGIHPTCLSHPTKTLDQGRASCQPPAATYREP